MVTRRPCLKTTWRVRWREWQVARDHPAWSCDLRASRPPSQNPHFQTPQQKSSGKNITLLVVKWLPLTFLVRAQYGAKWSKIPFKIVYVACKVVIKLLNGALLFKGTSRCLENRGIVGTACEPFFNWSNLCAFTLVVIKLFFIFYLETTLTGKSGLCGLWWKFIVRTGP